MLDVTPLARLYARPRLRGLAAEDPVMVQRRMLAALLARARRTRFGLDHGFTDIRTVEEYQARVPLRRYEDFWQDYWRASFPRLTNISWPGTVPFFAVTSGTTTGITKNIPCSREKLAADRMAGLDIIVHHLANRPRSKVMAGRSFMLGGSTDLIELSPGIWSGDLSGIVAGTIPWWARLRYFPPRRLETITDWEAKIGRLAPASLDRDIRAISGTPSWLLLFFAKLAEVKPDTAGRLADFYPDLELVVHGGVSFAPYRAAFARLLAGGHAETREVYPASEGFIAVADRGDGDGLRLILDRGLFMEFVPVDELDRAAPTRHWLATAEIGVNYALVLSTNAGLWSYVVGDTVRFIDLSPPRIVISGRTVYGLSAVGEHLIAEEIEAAVAAAAAAIAAEVTDFSVGALVAERDREIGHHLYIVEFAEGYPAAPHLTAFASHLDAHLAAANEDYAVHRKGDYGLGRPRVHPVAPGTFAAWMKSRRQLGGQHKVPRVITDDALFRELRTFCGAK
ncbi:MAG: GH3 auxin-responsive promoter family protein [Rhodospirillales bacterium]